MRHEYAHAVVDLKYNRQNEPNAKTSCCCGHGPTWIKIAKLMRVDVKPYI